MRYRKHAPCKCTKIVLPSLPRRTEMMHYYFHGTLFISTMSIRRKFYPITFGYYCSYWYQKLLDVPQREIRKQCPSSRKSCWWRVMPGKLYVATSIVALKWTSCTGMFGVVTTKNLFIVSSLTLFPYFSCLLFPNFIGDRVNPRARHYRYHSEWVCLKANIPPTLTARLFSFIVVSFPSQRRNLHIRSVM